MPEGYPRECPAVPVRARGAFGVIGWSDLPAVLAKQPDHDPGDHNDDHGAPPLALAGDTYGQDTDSGASGSAGAGGRRPRAMAARARPARIPGRGTAMAV